MGSMVGHQYLRFTPAQSSLEGHYEKGDSCYLKKAIHKDEPRGGPAFDSVTCAAVFSILALLSFSIHHMEDHEQLIIRLQGSTPKNSQVLSILSTSLHV